MGEASLFPLRSWTGPLCSFCCRVGVPGNNNGLPDRAGRIYPEPFTAVWLAAAAATAVFALVWSVRMFLTKLAVPCCCCFVLVSEMGEATSTVAWRAWSMVLLRGVRRILADGERGSTLDDWTIAPGRRCPIILRDSRIGDLVIELNLFWATIPALSFGR